MSFDIEFSRTDENYFDFKGIIKIKKDPKPE